MKLHEDKFAFLNIINLIHEASSIKDWKRPEEQAVIWRKRSFLIFSCSEGFLIMRHFVRTIRICSATMFLRKKMHCLLVLW